MCALSAKTEKRSAAEEEYPGSSELRHVTVPAKCVAERFYQVQVWLSRQLQLLSFHDPVHTIYDPMEYAAGVYYHFVHRFCRTPKAVLVLGMNPGPWGMAQTGVPFGEIDNVKSYLCLAEYGYLVEKPLIEHPSRKITGFSCHRKEPSGLKLWNLIKVLSNNVSADQALSQLVIHNFCPLLFLKESGSNLTPAELKAGEVRQQLFNLCSEALLYSVGILQCQHILCIGKFAEKQATALFKYNQHIKVWSIPHPSPRNAQGRKNWEENCIEKIIACGLLPFFQNEAPASSRGLHRSTT